jgi:hypothetical protein
MKVIIAGSRTIVDYDLVVIAVTNSGFEITELVCGEARGVDTCGRQWAEKRQIPIKSFPANWDANGRRAGPMRNRQMAEYAEALILIWDGKSFGSANMLKEAKYRSLKIYELIV